MTDDQLREIRERDRGYRALIKSLVPREESRPWVGRIVEAANDNDMDRHTLLAAYVEAMDGLCECETERMKAERQRDEAIKARSDREIECGRLEAQRDAARAEVERLQQWVNDLQSGMYINCVYCGHRYGPDPGTPVAMAEVLKRHIEQCPSHPLSHVKARLAKAEGVLRVIAEGHGQLATMASMARAYFAEQGAETQEETP